MRSPVLAKCRDCGAVFDAVEFWVEDSSVSFVGCEAACPRPRCGGVGDVLDGEFVMRGGSTRVLSAPRWTLDVLRSLQRALTDPALDGADDATVAERLTTLERQVEGVSDLVSEVLAATKTKNAIAPRLLLWILSVVVAFLIEQQVATMTGPDQVDLTPDARDEIREVIREELRKAGVATTTTVAPTTTTPPDPKVARKAKRKASRRADVQRRRKAR